VHCIDTVVTVVLSVISWYW